MDDKTEPLADVVEHLQYLGYSISRKNEEMFLASHDSDLDFWFSQLGGGVNLTSIISIELILDRNGKIELVNDVNAGALVSRAYVISEGDIVIEAWWPRMYERQAFGTFMKAWNRDLDKFVSVLEEKNLVAENR